MKQRLPYFMEPTPIFKKGDSRFLPELYNKEVLLGDKTMLKKAMFYFSRLYKQYEIQDAKSADEMSAWGAPTEDFRESGYFNAYNRAISDTIEKYPRAEKYLLRASRNMGKLAPHGMGRYDIYEGL